MSDDSPPEQKRDDLLRFVERFAVMLNEAGLPRMPARVFAYVLAEDADHYTAAELAEGLQVSRAAISGAVRMLVAGGLLSREREPGSRSDVYRIDDEDVWATINDQRMKGLKRWAQAIEEGIDLVGRETRGGRRLRESQAYFLFIGEKLPELLDEWHRNKDTLTARLTDD